VVGQGPPAVFLHGWGLDHKVYHQALLRLARSGRTVYAPALPGFGATASLPRAATSIGAYADWVADFMDAVGLEEPALVLGHSFGGAVAIHLAYGHPRRAAALVLINSIGGSAWQRRGSVVRSMAERPLWDWGLHFPADLLPLRQAHRVLPVILSEALPNLVRDPRAFWDAAPLARRADLSAELAELRRRGLPVAVLWGERDRLVTRDCFESLCETLGQPTVATVPGSHSWLVADPEAFGEVMTNVLGVLEAVAAAEPAA
jgi:pimeloyl-ACP methyl ester carboxylesterase